MTGLQAFRDLRDGLSSQRAGGGGLDTSQTLTEALDDAIRALAAGISGQMVAVLAVGGYGRREQCIHSDIDIAIIHDGADTATLARSILYPLWDAGLKVGHAVRTISESNAAGKERFDTLTTQLSSRLIAGDAELYDRYLAGLAKNLTQNTLVDTLAIAEMDRREASPYQVMSADVKSGRGALRTFQGFWWVRRRAELLGEEVELPHEEELQAFDSLIAVRNALHAVTGRSVDRYAFDLREPAAAWLGSDVMTVSRRLCDALSLGDHLAEERWPRLLAPAKRSRARSLKRSLRPSKVASSGPLTRAVSLLDRPAEIGDVVVLEPSRPWPDAERRAFIHLIGSGRRGRAAFNQLDRAGWLDHALPEWQAVRSLPQLAPFHEHPADAHLWRTADEMAGLLDEVGTIRGGVAASLGADDELLLSAFLHDIGKGRGGDHSILGAEAAESFMRRVGYGARSTETVAEAIRNHLLLIRTATRRDIADPVVIDEVVETVADIRRLQMLYLLTIADNRATGAHMWSEWKETLLTQLYMRAAGRMSGGGSAPRPRAEEIAELTEAGLGVEEVEAHLSRLPDDYQTIMSSADIAWHLDGLTGLSDDHTSLSIDRSGRTVLATGRDRRGFLLAVCRAFAAHGVGIHDARIYTRDDGIAIDTFHVLDDLRGETIPESVWPEVAHTLEEIEASGLDVTPRVRHRAEVYDSKAPSAVSVTMRDEISDRHLVVEVRSPDRVGLLSDIVLALYREDLDLKLARIDTRGDEAIDVLHLEPPSSPLREEEKSALCRRLEQAITSEE